MFTASEPSKLVLDVLGQSSNRSLHDVSLETNTFPRTFAYQDGIQKCRLARLLQAHQSNLSFLLKERILYPVNTHFCIRTWMQAEQHRKWSTVTFPRRHCKLKVSMESGGDFFSSDKTIDHLEVC